MSNKKRLTEEEMHRYALWLHEECNDPVDEVIWLLHHCMAPDKEHVTEQVKNVIEFLDNKISERERIKKNYD